MVAGSAPRGLFSTAYDPVEGPDGGEVVIGSTREAGTFNPYYVTETADAFVAAATWATLVVVTGDGRYAPDLAERIPTVENGGVRVPGDPGDAMTVTWMLRERLEWSDGIPMTCDDFRYAWEWVLDPDNANVATAGFEDITAWDCPTPTEMVLHFDAVFEGYLSLVSAPLPRHWLGRITVADQVRGAGIRPDEVVDLPVSGPFRFELVTPGAELRLARNPSYLSWATGLPAHLDPSHPLP